MHAFANPTRFLTLARPLTLWTLVLGALLSLGGAWAGLTLTPPDYYQGETVRIMYVHVPAAWLGMGAWMSLAIAGLTQLIWRHPLAGIAARAIALPGMMFTALCLITGAIWGKPTWGTWWAWDGRMTSMLVLFFLYAGFVALANLGEDKGSLSRVAAVYPVIGAINIPIINRSVVWFNGLHQQASITFKGSTIAPEILWPLWLTLAGASCLFAAIVLMRMRASLANIRVQARMLRLAMKD